MILSRRRLALGLAAILVLSAACDAAAPGSPAAAPSALATPSPDVPPLVTAQLEVGPPPGPVKPFRGVVTHEVQIYEGWVSMRFLLHNTGEEPITFLNTLYDYEPLQLYEPLVRLEWTDGTAASNSRRGRFFPTPAILQPGEEAVYLMGAQPVMNAGSGQIGDLVTHIKYCPTRGMDDRPGLPLEVSELEWETRDGVTTVRGTLRETRQERRFGSPTVGVQFVGTDGEFLGAIVDDGVGEPLEPGAERPFEVSGPGIRADQVGSLSASAWMQ